jgi:hypothetical protein
MVLRRMAYPDPEMEKRNDGSYVRFATTSDFKYMVNKISGKNLDWFFDVYMHQPLLPALNADIKGDKLSLSWVTPQNLPFPMPIDIKNGDKIRRVEIPQGGTVLSIDPAKEVIIDPEKWVLLKPWGMEEAKHMLAGKNYTRAKKYLNNCLLVDSSLIAVKNALQHINYITRTDEKNIAEHFLKLTGRYKLSFGWEYVVTKEDSGFFIESSRAKYQVFPVSDNTYITFDADLKFIFKLNKQGRPETLDIIAPGRKFTAEFINRD